jgi:PAS domain S-box-containing protein
MHYYFTAVSLIAGICLGFGILYLFIGLRRRENKPLYLTFAIFALCYAATLFNGIRWYSTNNISEFVAINRFDSIFVVGAFVGLIWYVSYYSDYRPRIFLWVLSAAFLFSGLVFIISPATFIGEVSGLINIALPWGEQLTNLDSSGSIWLDINLLARLVTLGFIIFALVNQFRRGERQAATIFGLGLLPFTIGIFYEVLGEFGFVPYIPLGEIGFLGIAIVASLQMSNSVIKTEEALEQHRQNLEGMVDERTEEFEQSNLQLSNEISTRVQAEAALRQSERRARALLDAPPDSAMLVDMDGTILDLNEIAATRLGIDVRDSIGKNVYTLIDDTLAEQRRSKADQLVETKEPVTWEDERLGRSYENHLYPILDDDDQVASIAIFARDITELKKVQEQEMVDAAAQERTRLARDLHDAVTQTIYSASLIAEVLPNVWERNPAEGQRNLVKLRQLVRGALAEMRTLLFELRPASLEAAELTILLQHLGDSLTGRTRIPVAYQLVEDSSSPKEIKIAVYRIAQEVFNNIAKHSGATQVSVDLVSKSNQVKLHVLDDGRGFERDEIAGDKLGIKIMTERASEIDAKLEIISSPRKGTKVSVSWESEEYNLS